MSLLITLPLIALLLLLSWPTLRQITAALRELAALETGAEKKA